MDKAICCLHVADLHLGVENYGFTNPRTGLNTRLEDFRDSLAQAIDAAIEYPVDLALFAGDAYKRNFPNPTEQRELVNQFCRLADAGIPTVMISGNHDIPVMQGKASSIDIFRTIRPGMFHVFINQPSLEPVLIETAKGPIAVCALPYISPSFLKNFDEYRKLQGEEFREAYERFYLDVIQTMAKAAPNDVPRVLLAHLTVHGALFGGYRGSAILTDEVQILPANMVNADYDYVALGHIHRHQNLSPDRNIPVVYAGSIDRVDFSESTETKGYVIAKISRGSSTYEFKQIANRLMVQIKVPWEDGIDLIDRILGAIEKETVENAIVRVSFEADDEELQKLDMKKIQEALKPAHFKAGFQRIQRNAESRRHAAVLNAEVSLPDALSAYIREHEELKEDGPALLEKAKEIDAFILKKE